MIFFDHHISEEANFCTDTHSSVNGKEYNYTYFMELGKAYANRTLPDDLYFDYCVLVNKFKWWN
jgi:hypothetical protein